jgi:hypothetical protein
VEIDGQYHAGRQTADLNRDDYMRQRGLSILSISAARVMNNCEQVVGRDHHYGTGPLTRPLPFRERWLTLLPDRTDWSENLTSGSAREGI